uniref:Uncharacterized protein n=1 Tax=Anguilla anguilla TaxID=7936 RepID=A0A0E9QDR6_ANGAN
MVYGLLSQQMGKLTLKKNTNNKQIHPKLR